MAATEQCPEILQPGMTDPLVKIINMLDPKSFLALCCTSKGMHAFCMNTRGIKIVIRTAKLKKEYLKFHNTPFVVHLFWIENIPKKNADYVTKTREELKKHSVKTIGRIWAYYGIEESAFNDFVDLCHEYKIFLLEMGGTISNEQFQVLLAMNIERLRVDEVDAEVGCMKSRIPKLNEDRRNNLRVSLSAMDSVLESWMTNDLVKWKFWLNADKQECVSFCKKHALFDIDELEGSLPTQRPLFLFENSFYKPLWIVKTNEKVIRLTFYAESEGRVNVKCGLVPHYACPQIINKYFEEKRKYAGLSWRMDKEVGVYDLMDAREQLSSQSISSLHYLVINSIREGAFEDFVSFCRDFKLSRLDIRQGLSNTQLQALLAMDLKCLRVREVVSEVDSVISAIPELEIHGTHLSLKTRDSIIQSALKNDLIEWRFYFKEYEKECLDFCEKYATIDARKLINFRMFMEFLHGKRPLILSYEKYGTNSLYIVKADRTVLRFACYTVGKTKLRVVCSRISPGDYPPIIRKAYEKWNILERKPRNPSDSSLCLYKRVGVQDLVEEREKLSSQSIQSVHHVEVDFIEESATGEFVAFCRDFKVRRLDICLQISNEQLQALLAMDLEQLKVDEVVAVSSLKSTIPALDLNKTRSCVTLAAMDSVIESWLTNDLIKWRFSIAANKEECLELLKKYAPLDLKEIGDSLPAQRPLFLLDQEKKGPVLWIFRANNTVARFSFSATRRVRCHCKRVGLLRVCHSTSKSNSNKIASMEIVLS